MKHWTTQLDELEAEGRTLRKSRAMQRRVSRRKEITMQIEANEAEIRRIRREHGQIIAP